MKRPRYAAVLVAIIAAAFALGGCKGRQTQDEKPRKARPAGPTTRPSGAMEFDEPATVQATQPQQAGDTDPKVKAPPAQPRGDQDGDDNEND